MTDLMSPTEFIDTNWIPQHAEPINRHLNLLFHYSKVTHCITSSLHELYSIFCPSRTMHPKNELIIIKKKVHSISRHYIHKIKGIKLRLHWKKEIYVQKPHWNKINTRQPPFSHYTIFKQPPNFTSPTQNWNLLRHLSAYAYNIFEDQNIQPQK